MLVSSCDVLLASEKLESLGYRMALFEWSWAVLIQYRHVTDKQRESHTMTVYTTLA